MKSSTYRKIKETGKLPSPSGVALELLRLVDDEKTTIDQITATVEADPAIASRLLTLVNSPFFGVSQKVVSVSAAVKLLGRRTVKNLTLGLSLISTTRDGASKTFDYERFWSESLARAVAARSLATEFSGCDDDEAFTVALLSDVGRLALATAYPESYDDLLTPVSGDATSSLLETERKAFGIDHNNLAAEMMADWGIAEVSCEAVRRQDNADRGPAETGSPVVTIAGVLELASAIAAVLTEEWAGCEELEALLQAGRTIGVKRDVLVDVFESVKEEWRELGSVFSVRTQDGPSLQDVPADTPSGKGKILIVDDDPQIIHLLVQHLGKAGFEVLTSTNGIEALRKLHSEECRIVITDWMMPEMDGLELCRIIRESEVLGFVYVLVLTALTDQRHVMEAFEAGADDYLPKPYQPQELLARLKAATRILKLEANLERQQRALHKTNAELATTNGTLHQLATTDELTGLYNRREAMRRLEGYWATATRDTRPLACMMLDIDHFKQCNDKHGHDVGDAVLRETAQILRQTARKGETVFRIGGEEFLVLCPGATAEMAGVGAERLRAAVETNRITTGDTASGTTITVGVTISGGVAEQSNGSFKSDDLLRNADSALYEAKSSGRNRVCVAGTNGVTSPQRSTMENASVQRTAAFRKCAGSDEALGRVFVVDDDPSARRLFRMLLEREGFQVHEACDGMDALAHVADVMPDIILMDAVMPKLDGFACTRKLMADPITCEIPIIMVSGQADEKHVEAGFEAGAKEYITKPIRHREFVLRIQTMMELHRGKASLARSNEVRGEQARAMGLLFDYSQSLAVVDSIGDIVNQAVQVTSELTGCRRISIMLPEKDGKELLVVAAVGLGQDLASRIRVPVGGAIAGQVFATGKSTVINTPEEGNSIDTRYDSAFFASIPLASNPLVAQKHVLGVLSVTDRRNGQPFGAHELEYLNLICNMTASALEQAQTLREREDAYAAIVTGLAKLAEHRDADTGNHLERVTRYATILVTELRRTEPYGIVIDDEFVQDLERAMPLHDIGKVAVPDAILLKPGKLTADEFASMKQHSEIGAMAIQSVIDRAASTGFLVTARDIAHAHHEWFDGSGYPRGLRGDAIPLAARIAAVADVYDALTTKRPYKEAFPHETAVGIIREASGSHFDPDVVEAFLRREKDFACYAARLKDDIVEACDVEPARVLVALTPLGEGG